MIYNTGKPLTTSQTEPILSWTSAKVKAVRQKHATYEAHKFHLRNEYDISGCALSEDRLKQELISDHENIFETAPRCPYLKSGSD